MEATFLEEFETMMTNKRPRNFYRKIALPDRIITPVRSSIVAGPLFRRETTVTDSLTTYRPSTYSVVDDSKPYRIKLRSMLQHLFPHINILMCGSPTEGLRTILSATKDIKIVISDNMFVGTEMS